MLQKIKQDFRQYLSNVIFILTALTTLLHYVENLVFQPGQLHSALAPQHSLLLCVNRYSGEGKLKHYFISHT